MILFCLAQFLDVYVIFAFCFLIPALITILHRFNNSALFSAIPSLHNELGFDESGITWLISAYQLTFASFLLIAGKISDVYDPS